MNGNRSKHSKGEQEEVCEMEAIADSEADGVFGGCEEPVPGMRLRCICHGHQGTIGSIVWSTSGRFITSPSEDKTHCIWGRWRKVLELKE